MRAYCPEEALRGPEVSVNGLQNAFLERFGILHEPVFQMHIISPFLNPETVLSVYPEVERLDYDSTVSHHQHQK